MHNDVVVDYSDETKASLKRYRLGAIDMPQRRCEFSPLEVTDAIRAKLQWMRLSSGSFRIYRKDPAEIGNQGITKIVLLESTGFKIVISFGARPCP
jgi:hypothetical protein